MNGVSPVFHVVAKSEHEQRIKKAAEHQQIRLIREERGEVRSMRGRIGLIVMRAGARLVPDGELAHERRKQVFG